MQCSTVPKRRTECAESINFARATEQRRSLCFSAPSVLESGAFHLHLFSLAINGVLELLVLLEVVQLRRFRQERLFHVKTTLGNCAVALLVSEAQGITEVQQGRTFRKLGQKQCCFHTGSADISALKKKKLTNTGTVTFEKTVGFQTRATLKTKLTRRMLLRVPCWATRVNLIPPDVKSLSPCCVMDVRDQTRQAFVTDSGPCCDSTSKFVHRP